MLSFMQRRRHSAKKNVSIDYVSIPSSVGPRTAMLKADAANNSSCSSQHMTARTASSVPVAAQPHGHR